MAFSTKECSWAQTSVKLLGRTLEGIRGFEFNKQIDKEVLYGAGQVGIDILEGNKEIDGSITILKYELDLLNDAAKLAGYMDITEVPYTAIVITCAYQLTSVSKLRTHTVPGAAFTKMGIGMKQNDKGTEIQLPFKAIEVITI